MSWSKPNVSALLCQNQVLENQTLAALAVRLVQGAFKMLKWSAG
jgi:hypothetical protein